MSKPVDSAITPRDSATTLRRSLAWLLILCGLAITTARIAAIGKQFESSPFLSANDRSRWCTIRALVDDGTFAIDSIIFDAEGKRIRGWHTIDLVRHQGRDGREHYYSSKPVLMPTLMAGVYWVVKQTTGASLTDEPFYAGRIVLWLCNVPPLLLMWVLLARLIERYSHDDWTRIFTVAAMIFGTLLTTFSITLNNHLHAAVCVTVVLYSLSRIHDGHRSYIHFALAGLFSALAFANELPALSLLCLIAFVITLLDWKRSLIAFAPPATAVVAAIVGLNYWAHGSVKPAYTHRHDGAIERTERVLSSDDVPIKEMLIEDAKFSREITVAPRLPKNEGDDVADRWNVFDPQQNRRFAVYHDRQQRMLEVRTWGNWYEYEGTNWQAANKQGVDRGEPSVAVYAFNVLIGHHGLFSLTPLWLIAIAGLLHSLYHRDELRWFAAGTLLLLIVCLAFYISRPLEDRNYGGWCNGARWLFWLIPMLLVAMIPALDVLAKNRWGRTAAILCLLASIFSAWYTPTNPWSHPWLYDYWTYLGWIAY